MPWSEKNVEDAIGEAKRKNAIFVVYIEDDSGTASLEHVIQDPEVSELLSTHKFIAVRIGSSSQSYTFFASIYQIVPVPSLFFIGQSGWPLEIVTIELPIDSVAERIRRLTAPPDVSRVFEEPSSSVSETTSTGTSVQTFKTQLNALNEDIINVESEASVVCETPAPSTSIKPESITYETSSLMTTLTASPTEESVASVCPLDFSGTKEAAKQILSQRSSCKDTVATTSHEQERVTGHCQEETVQEEMAKKICFGITERNEKMLEPIKETSTKSDCTLTSSTNDDVSRSVTSPSADVLDKDIKQGSHVQVQHDPNVETRTLSRSTESHHSPPAPGILDSMGVWVKNVMYGGSPTTLRASRSAEESTNSASCISSVHSSDGIEGDSRWPEHAHIQFRLPDGSTQSQLFLSSTTMGEVREHVRNNLSLSFRVFSLATSYPRLEFTNAHNAVSIGALGLAPRSVILIIPGSGVSEETAWSVDTLWTLLLWPFSAMYSLYTFLHLSIFGGDPAVSGTTSSSLSSLTGAEQQSTTSQPTQSRNISGARRRTPATSTIQRDGNVHRLSNRQDESDDDDDNNTWNGNSTQQM